MRGSAGNGKRLGQPLIAIVGFAVTGLATATAAAAEPRLVTWYDRAVCESRFVAIPDSCSAPTGSAGRPWQALRVNVYLPAGYRRGTRTRYPVLYLMGGSTDSYASWAYPQQGDIMATLPDFPGFIVMPEFNAPDANGFYSNWWNHDERGNPRWQRYHLEQIVPYVERRLPIRRDRRWHAIAGNSLGGLGAVYYATQLPEYFGSAAAFSGVLSSQRSTWATPASQLDNAEDAWGDQSAQEFNWRGHNPKQLVENLRHTRIYAATGDGTGPGAVTDPFGAFLETELAGHLTEFADAARGAGVDVTDRLRQGVHGWSYWRDDVRAAAGWDFFGGVPAAPGRWIYRTVEQRGRMWGFQFRFEAPLNETVRFERAARRLSATGSGKVTIRRGKECRFSDRLPFQRRLPRGCRAAG
jgi:S-formylglutathione hydrolase FrmB